MFTFTEGDVVVERQTAALIWSRSVEVSEAKFTTTAQDGSTPLHGQRIVRKRQKFQTNGPP